MECIMYKMKRKLFCILILIGIFSLSGAQSRAVYLTDSPGEELLSVRIIEQDIKHTRIEIEVRGFLLSEEYKNGIKYHRIDVPGMTHLRDGEHPDLPRLYKTIQIPDMADVSFSILEQEEYRFEDCNILPSENPVLGEDMQSIGEENFNPDNFSGALFSLGKPVILRNVRGIKFCFSPFKYDGISGELSITKRLLADINYKNSVLNNSQNLKINAVKRSKVFDPIYSRIFINFNRDYSRCISEDIDIDGDKMIIFTTPEYEKSLADYLKWKKERGFDVELDVISAGHGASAVEKKIRQKYEKEGLTYIILIGDIDDVPSKMISGAPSDPSYALLEGDDLIGDALISRISVNTVEELENQINKIMIYEKGLFENTDWIFHGVIACMTGFDGINHSSAIEKAMNEHPQFFKEVVKIMESDSDITRKLREAIEVFGTSVIAHHGHGSTNGFNSIPFPASEAKKLRSTGRGFPFVHGAACLTGSFQIKGEDCLAEAFMKAGIVNEPAGAIGFLGGTTSMDPYACIMAQKEIFAKQYYENIEESIGAMCYRGTLFAVTNLSEERAERLYRRWHLFGDCSTIIWKRVPQK